MVYQTVYHTRLLIWNFFSRRTGRRRTERPGYDIQPPDDRPAQSPGHLI